MRCVFPADEAALIDHLDPLSLFQGADGVVVHRFAVDRRQVVAPLVGCRQLDGDLLAFAPAQVEVAQHPVVADILVGERRQVPFGGDLPSCREDVGQRKVGVPFVAAGVRDGHDGVEIGRYPDRGRVDGGTVHIRVTHVDPDAVRSFGFLALAGGITLADARIEAARTIVPHLGRCGQGHARDGFVGLDPLFL